MQAIRARACWPATRRARAGVFVGVMYGDYQLFGPEEAARGGLIGPNAAYWNIANRVSWFMDFRGPSMAIDTACSSSLSAIHMACASLRAGDCSVAIAGGVNLSVHPSKYWTLSKAGMLSSDGRCRSFGEGGDGYVPGEGIGALLLKPLTKALADGDHVYGVILGSSVNHGGRTNGYTVPNAQAQGELVVEALHRSGVEASDIGYLEAHGTGTSLGDPIELAGLSQAFAGAAPASCSLGSVKSNIGHLESAAGVAAVTKVLLQLEHRQLVPTLHVERANPNLALDGSPFVLQHEAAPGSSLTALRAGGRQLVRRWRGQRACRPRGGARHRCPAGRRRTFPAAPLGRNRNGAHGACRCPGTIPPGSG